eukprot:IDg10663t1
MRGSKVTATTNHNKKLSVKSDDYRRWHMMANDGAASTTGDARNESLQLE